MRVSIVTLNPGVDRIVYLPGALKPGDLNRTDKAVMNQGSKGANQAIMFRELGEEPVYYSFTGGAFGAYSDSFTQSRGIPSHFVPTRAGVRLNIKVIDGEGGCTELNERGGPVSCEEMAEMVAQIRSGFHSDTDYDKGQVKCDMLSLCGSIPQGVEKSVYNSLITLAKAENIPTVLDCDGEALAIGLQAKPALIKPNRRELAGLMGESEEKLRDIRFLVEACGKILSQYDTEVLCTLDSEGSIFVGKSGVFHIGVAKVPLRGFSGAGDTYLSAFMHKYYGEKSTIEEALRYGAAASCAKVQLLGTELPGKEMIEVLLEKIVVKKIC